MTVTSSAKGDKKEAAETDALPFEETKEKVEVKEQPDTTEVEEPEDLDPKYMEMLMQLQGKIARLEAEHIGSGKATDTGILADDYLDEPRVYHCFSSYYAVWDDTRLGKRVATPYGNPIRFRKLYRFTKTDKVGRGVQTVCVSQAVIHSKKEAEFIEAHRFYGIKFAREIKAAEDDDVMLAEKMVEIANMVSSMDDMAVVGRARNEDLDVQTADVAHIRKHLIKKLAKDAMATESQAKRQRVKATSGNVEDKKIDEQVEKTGTVDDSVYA